jgi:hypothetical protein
MALNRYGQEVRWRGVPTDIFYRFLQAHGLRAEYHYPEYRVYKGDELIATGTGLDPLYHWLKERYPPLLSARDISLAMSLLKPKMERELKKQLKGRAKQIKKDRARAAERYPWLK